MRWNLCVLAAPLVLAVIPVPVCADVSSHPCMMALAQGSLEERRAQFDRALALFKEARKEPLCEVEAQIGMARTFNSMNDHKDALAAAGWVLEHSEDPELLAEAQYEIGRALHKPGRRKTKDKTAAEQAFLQAVEHSEGRHRGAVRALMRLYEETRQEDRLAKLQERFPEIRASTRAKQMRAVRPKKKSAPAAGKLVESSLDCATKKITTSGVWELDLPRFCGPEPEEESVSPPSPVEIPRPESPEDDETSGTVELEVLISSEGDIEAVRISSGLSPGLDTAALDAACRSRFEPAKDAEGEPTRSYFCGAINF